MTQEGPSFEEAVTGLEKIASQLEAGEVKLEEALRLFERGVGLAKHGGRRLDEAERKLEALLRDGQVVPLEAEQPG